MEFVFHVNQQLKPEGVWGWISLLGSIGSLISLIVSIYVAASLWQIKKQYHRIGRLPSIISKISKSKKNIEKFIRDKDWEAIRREAAGLDAELANIVELTSKEARSIAIESRNYVKNILDKDALDSTLASKFALALARVHRHTDSFYEKTVWK